MRKIFVIAAVLLLTASFAATGLAFKKDVAFKSCGAEGKVVFSHEAHTEKAGLKCTECHSRLFLKKAGGNAGVNMAAMKAGKFCGACHDGKKAFSVSDKEGCGKCHKK